MDNENVLRPHIVDDLNTTLSVIESAHFDVAEVDLQDVGNLLGKLLIGIA